MPNYRKKIVVKPGARTRLKHFDPGYHGNHESRKSALPEIEKNRQKMDELQYLMYAEHKRSLLVVLQGLDAGGKDGTDAERTRARFSLARASACACQRFSGNFQSLAL